jgi:membrane-bound ClpP family serine protease
MPTTPRDLTVPNKEAQAAWKRVTVSDRRDVIRLAKHGERHADAEVAAAAFAWSHRAALNWWANTRPGWLLPSLGLVFLLVSLVAHFPVIMSVASVIVLILGLLGLLGWSSTASAAAIRRVYDARPADSEG